MLVFPLKKQWFDKIKRGEKCIEYREVKPYWTNRINNEFAERVDGVVLTPFNPRFMAACVECSRCPRPCILRLGYTKRQMTADITKIEVVDGKDTDLRVDKPVYAIHLQNVKEMIQCPHCGGSGMMLGDGLGVMECPWCGGDGQWETE